MDGVKATAGKQLVTPANLVNNLFASMCFAYGHHPPNGGQRLHPRRTRHAPAVKADLGFSEDEDRLASWSGQNCRGWDGVTCCNKTKRVVKLQLHRYGCPTSKALASLSHLEYLDLGHSRYFESIAAFIGSLKNLKHLDMSSLPSLMAKYLLSLGTGQG
ncbi:hypothetical protein E2562_026564 [Oryza meyeriana var. granulata]|uniref:Leucine-rich repeat-containing N-terminal plant-type domain-containing protein n=1 Tax=Oryza meyeriana var. granulata TaxID=110450 RepID=A0A6G1CT23_9ORYZ|nr:hypothetical protein E2562_026564 [Oryza meyeriana var. granulata]